MRLLITGARGQVGSAADLLATRAGYDVVTPDRSAFDLAKPHSLKMALNRLQPTAILNAAAYTDVDAAEDDPQTAQRVNAAAPGVLAEWAAQSGAVMVHY
ncbi:MAG: sugar nucleotide-binding protein, partial [Pseudomonadota bacterium]